MKRVRVIGAGASGLSAAYFFLRAGWNVEILEREKKPGGMIASVSTPLGLVETAANAFVNSQILDGICRDIGIELEPALKIAKSRFIFRDHPQRWPLYASETLRLGRRAFAARFFSPDGFAARPEESVGAWGERCLGRAAVDYLLSPGLGGIYATDADDLSATLVLASLAEARRTAKGLARRGSVAPRGGMGQFMHALGEWLGRNGVTFHYEKKIADLTTQPDLPQILAVSLADAPALLAQEFPQACERMEKLRRIPLYSVTVFFPKRAIRYPGFGCLFPRDQGFTALGVLSNTHIFPGRTNEHSETWIFAPEANDGRFDSSDESILKLVRRDRLRLVREEVEFLAAKVTRWPAGIPCYDLQLERFLKSGIVEGLGRNGIFLHGNYLGRLGLTGILARSHSLPTIVEQARQGL